MRLSKIKISGFKSFVDATEILMPSNLIGVVGPNGCGKSNIIDAVRWVMGETSAKMLRGSDMTDVIFSGSSARKPVGLATVELIFDNSDGLIKGEYAQFNEISVKRQVNRDAQSSYFLNSSKCRKKDITDLFLGTGLGPRSYSIIEQGMISHIVESKPEELRGFIEEAAGVSKYRERRRETERRIQRTRENLERLDDLRTEVGKHLQHLQRQAKNAEKYTRLKQRHKTAKAELLVVRWLEWTALAEATEKQLNALKTDVEKARSALTGADAQLETQRQAHQQVQDDAAKIQERLYRINGDIGKIEQAIAHAKSLSERHQNELQRYESQRSENQQQLKDDEAAVESIQTHLDQLAPRMQKSEAQLEQSKGRSEAAETALNQWRGAWDELTAKLAEKNRQVEVEQTRIQALEESMLRGDGRLANIRQKTADSPAEDLHNKAGELAARVAALQAQLSTAEEALQNGKQAHAEVQETRRIRQQECNELLNGIHQNKGERQSLVALQSAAQSNDAEEVGRWIDRNSGVAAERLSQLLEVDGGYEPLVELVLGHRLQSLVCHESSLHETLADWRHGRITAVHSSGDAQAAQPGTLAQHVKGPAVVNEWFNQVRVCDNLAAALPLQAQLQAGQMLAVRDEMLLLGRNWITLNRGQEQEQGGFLLRQKKLRALEKTIARDEKTLQAMQQELADLRQQDNDLQGEIEQRRMDANMVHRRHTELQGQLNNARQQIEQLQSLEQQMGEEAEQISRQMAHDKSAVKQARKTLQTALDELERLNHAQSQLRQQQTELIDARTQAKAALDAQADEYYGLKLNAQSLDSELRSKQQGMQRIDAQLKQLQDNKAQLLAQMDADLNPVKDQESSLQQLISERLEVEKTRDASLREVNSAREALETLEKQRSTAQQSLEAVQERTQASQLEWQSHRLKADGFNEQLADQGFDARELAESVDAEQDAATREERIEQLHRSIVRLEPVNLAAIEEYDEESKRKQYLDEQNDDLQQALETLEAAIRRIDKDTRTLFKETFEQINANVKQLFPRLFGGGHAYLELTGGDLLTTGVAIMARPPGKRVSSIQLLSGGEKALTAVSLVFAIFNLNPAPFCLLDEVDAPLDDANVKRFSDLVAEMSEKVQFLFVTHNKITMEIAHQLMGVTMREAGVSRLVSVDLDEAEQMLDD